MTNLFFPGMQEVGERIASVPHLLLGLDYDGTLTPIVEHPTLARLSAPVREVLWSLAWRRDDVTLAVLSGRRRAELQELVGLPGLIYAGNHGLEISGPGFSFIEPAAVAASRALHLLALDLTQKLKNIQGAFVEDKGLTLSVHYRQVAAVDREEVWRTVYSEMEKANEPFHVTTGAKVYEIRPHRRWHKGTALRWIMGRLNQRNSLVIYIGDDVTDEDAFAGLEDAAVTIKVGDNVETAAKYVLPGPAEVRSFLYWVDQLLQEKIVSEGHSWDRLA